VPASDLLAILAPISSQPRTVRSPSLPVTLGLEKRLPSAARSPFTVISREGMTVVFFARSASRSGVVHPYPYPTGSQRGSWGIAHRMASVKASCRGRRSDCGLPARSPDRHPPVSGLRRKYIADLRLLRRRHSSSGAWAVGSCAPSLLNAVDRRRRRQRDQRIVRRRNWPSFVITGRVRADSSSDPPRARPVLRASDCVGATAAFGSHVMIVKVICG